jgi:hypothetical protein
MTDKEHSQADDGLKRELAELHAKLDEAEARAKQWRQQADDELERCRLMRAEMDRLAKAAGRIR